MPALSEEKKQRLIESVQNLPASWQKLLVERTIEWQFKKARPKQLEPEGEWNIWMLLGGRGAGKTIVMANWVRDKAIEFAGCRIAVVGQDFESAQKVLFDGESGLFANIPREAIKSYNKTTLVLEIKNGSIIYGYSSQEPDKFRGPQFHFAALDEFAAYDYAQEVFDTIKYAVRLGKKPKTLITTTPRPIPIILELRDRKDVAMVTMSLHENRENLPDTLFQNIAKDEGTEYGRQEIYGEILSLDEHAIIKKSWFKIWENEQYPEFEFIIQSYDTGYKEKASNDPSACIVLGLFFNPETKWYNVMLIHGWVAHLAYPDLRQKVLNEFHNVKYGQTQHRADLVLIEDKGSGQSLYQDLREVFVPARAWNPGRENKVLRAQLVAYLISGGMVHIPKHLMDEANEQGTWMHEFMKQISTFGPTTVNTKGQHDDFIDTLTQALAFFRDSNMLRMDTDRKYASVYMNEQEEEIARIAASTPHTPRVNPYAV